MYDGCNYLSMPGIKLNHVSQTGRSSQLNCLHGYSDERTKATIAVLILGLCTANDRRRYKLTTSLIGWVANLESALTLPIKLSEQPSISMYYITKLTRMDVSLACIDYSLTPYVSNTMYVSGVVVNYCYVIANILMTINEKRINERNGNISNSYATLISR